jgi:hypothetical protein
MAVAFPSPKGRLTARRFTGGESQRKILASRRDAGNALYIARSPSRPNQDARIGRSRIESNKESP